MKLSKAIEMLENNNKLKFRSNKRDNDGSYSEISCKKSEYIYVTNYEKNGKKEIGERTDFNGMICNKMNWELIEEPMTFEELLKAKNVENKFIRVEYKGFKTCYDSLKYTMKYLSENTTSCELLEIINNGSWYIKE